MTTEQEDVTVEELIIRKLDAIAGDVAELRDAFREYRPVLDHFTKTTKGPMAMALRRAAKKAGKS